MVKDVTKHRLSLAHKLFHSQKKWVIMEMIRET